MTDNLQTVIKAAEQLSPNEQLELIEVVSRSLQRQYQPKRIHGTINEFAPAIPAEVKRTSPLQDVTQLKADFWPEDETADDINAFIEQQRQVNLLRSN